MGVAVEARAKVLADHGARPAEIEELLAYNESHFDHGSLPGPLRFPLAPEPYVAAWETYADRAGVRGTLAELRERLVQLRFPIAEGISRSEAYRAATLRGAADGAEDAAGCALTRPGEFRLVIHPSLGGPIPVLIPAGREDFVALVRALARRNEPELVPDSMGACMVAGYNNWDRIRRYRAEWEAAHRDTAATGGWAAEFKRLMPRKELYQDRFIIISDGPYSDVPAAAMRLSDAEWRCLSLAIRIEHESLHYFTRRALGSSRNNVLDELIADYAGIVAVLGHFRADWALRFMGLEDYPAYREGGRLQNYLGEPRLSDGAFAVLRALVRAAAENLERFDAAHSEDGRDARSRALWVLALSTLTLEALASDGAPALLLRTLETLEESAGHVHVSS